MGSTTLEGSTEEPQEPQDEDRPDEQVAETEPTRRPRVDLELQRIAGVVAAIAMAGAGIIHFAYAPTHLDEKLSHGIFFLVTGWLQITLAATLVLRTRPQRVWLGLTVTVNLAIVAVWVVSRTVGVPGSVVESIGFPDVTASVLEAVAVLAAFAVLAGVLANRAIHGNPAVGFAGVSALATVALVSMAVSPSFAGEHSHGAAGHTDGGGAAAAGHSHGASTVDPATWAKERQAALEGHATPKQVEQFKQAEADYLATQIRRRSDLLRTLPESEQQDRIDAYTRWAVDNTLALLEGAQSHGASGGGMHTHGPVTWQAITDPKEQKELQGQLEEAAGVIVKYPTVADAEAGGYRQISPYVPGIGAHWINGNFDDKFDPGKPEMLLYNGTEKTSRIVGLSYAAIGSKPPEGFVGPNDQWHSHPGLCLLGNLVVGIDGTPKDLCESIGGEIASNLSRLQMMHLWQVPGYQSSWGLFSAENDNINVTTSDIGRSLGIGG